MTPITGPPAHAQAFLGAAHHEVPPPDPLTGVRMPVCTDVVTAYTERTDRESFGVRRLYDRAAPPDRHHGDRAARVDVHAATSQCPASSHELRPTGPSPGRLAQAPQPLYHRPDGPRRYPTPTESSFPTQTNSVAVTKAKQALAKMPPKPDFPPLLPEGLHAKALEDLQSLCVNNFPLSSSRPRLMSGLRMLVRALSEAGVHADLWIDGSFLTLKLNPEDIDVVLCMGDNEEPTETQKELLLRLRSTKPSNENYARAQYGCDFYFSPQSRRAYWRRWYGHDRKGNPKGIAAVRINGGAR